MAKEVPSVNPKLDSMCEMLKTIHGLRERNKMLEAQIEKMKCCGNCIHDVNEDDVIVQTDYCDNCFEFCNWKLRR